MCFIVDERCDVWNVTTPRARKSHHCYECGCEIPKGTLHERINAMFDKEWNTYRCCVSCVGIRASVEAHEIAEGCGHHEAIPPLGDLWNAAREIRLFDLVDDKPNPRLDDYEITSEYHAPEPPPRRDPPWLVFM